MAETLCPHLWPKRETLAVSKIVVKSSGVVLLESISNHELLYSNIQCTSGALFESISGHQLLYYHIPCISGGCIRMVWLGMDWKPM